MKPTITLIMMGCCALTSACRTSSGSRGDDALDDLAHFYLPRVQMKNVTLDTALRQVEADYRETCRKGGDKPQRFTLTTNGEPGTRVNMDGRGVNAGYAIQILAAQAGMETSAKGNNIVLNQIPDDETVSKREYKVPPTFLTDIAALSGRSQSVRRDDASVLRSLRKQSLLKSRDARASYDPRSSALNVTATGFEQHQLKAFLKAYAMQRPMMLKLTIKRVTFDNDPKLPVGILSNDATNRWLKRAKGGDLNSLPSITMLPGKSGTIEVIRELSSADKNAWVGTRVECEVSLIGFANATKINYGRRLAVVDAREIPFEDGQNLNRGDEQEKALKPILGAALKGRQSPLLRTREASIHAPIPDQHYLITKTTGTSTGTEYVLVSVARIDATGRPIRPWE